MNTIAKKSSELKTGDVVLCHGMRCLIDGAVESGKGIHDDIPVYWTRAKVLNRDEVDPRSVPLGYTRSTRWEGDCWTIQGNDRASWCVEVPS